MEETDVPPAFPASQDELTKLDPRYRTVMRIVASIWAVILLIAALVGEVFLPERDGWIALPALIVAAVIVLRIPSRRWSARGYTLADERLRVVRGILFNTDTVVPFGRVQHIDVNQGPLERAYHLATLTVHTAGTHNSSVNLPGLALEDALAMRETIRAAIKRDTL